MKLTPRAMLSVGLGLVGIVVLGTGLSRLLDTGSCASGGPYASTRPCPDGTGLWVVLMVVGLIIWMVGLSISKGGLAEPGSGQVVWTLGFAGGGIALLVKALAQPSLGPDAKLGIYILAAVFIPMGLAVGIAGLVQRSRQRRRTPRRERSAAPAARTTDPAKQLQRLRSTGALTRAEFDQLKGDPPADRLTQIQQLAELHAAGVLTAAEFDAKKRAVIQSVGS